LSYVTHELLKCNEIMHAKTVKQEGLLRVMLLKNSLLKLILFNMIHQVLTSK